MGERKDHSKGTKKVLISRREFFAALVPVFSIPALLWWIFTAGRTTGVASRRKEIIIPGEIPAGISIHQGVVLVKNKEGIRAFEAKCTHLGCKLNKIEKGEVVCPCHGSRFNEEGKPIKGPAANTLNELSISFDAANNTTIVK
jgi:Rieske Fe-S protein